MSPTSSGLKRMWGVLKGFCIDWKNPLFSKQLDSADYNSLRLYVIFLWCYWA